MDGIRDHCLLGGALGSLLSILRFRTDRHGVLIAVFLGSHTEVLATFIVNGVFAFAFSPLVCDMLLPWADIPKSQNACVALSSAIALGCPWLMKSAFPILGEKAEGFLKSLRPKMILERLLRLWDNKKG